MALRFVPLVLMLAVIAPAHAQRTGKGEAGLVISSGNTETETANVKLALAHERDKWKNSVGLAGLYASDDTGTTAQPWETTGESDYNFSPKTFWFGAARYEDDRFSGFDYQATISTGLGRKFIDSLQVRMTQVLALAVGYSVRHNTDPPIGFEKTDTLTTVNLVYEIK